jgi:hypothetical protein
MLLHEHWKNQTYSLSSRNGGDLCKPLGGGNAGVGGGVQTAVVNVVLFLKGKQRDQEVKK